MEVIHYNRAFGVGTCITENKRVCYIYKQNAKKIFDYLVKGEKIKGSIFFNPQGKRLIMYIEPLNEKYYHETHKEIHFVSC
jgi:hypothetical protein